MAVIGANGAPFHERNSILWSKGLLEKLIVAQVVKSPEDSLQCLD
jgi:hypothetical protein